MIWTEGAKHADHIVVVVAALNPPPEHLVKRLLRPPRLHAVLDGVEQRLHLVQRIGQVRRRSRIMAVEDAVRGLGGLGRGLFEPAGEEGAHHGVGIEFVRVLGIGLGQEPQFAQAALRLAQPRGALGFGKRLQLDLRAT